MDHSTLNATAIRQLPVWNEPPTYHLSATPGEGCSGDAPGFPTYFLRSVYTRHGNSPRKGAQTCIVLDGTAYVVRSSPADDAHDQERWRQRLFRLWNPLPADHERVRLWIAATWRFQGTAPQGREIALLLIRQFYPAYEPDEALLSHLPDPNVPLWWETEAACPPPDRCNATQRWGRLHRDEPGSWCQWCGQGIQPTCHGCGLAGPSAEAIGYRYDRGLCAACCDREDGADATSPR